jgi:hypothetical protein
VKKIESERRLKLRLNKQEDEFFEEVGELVGTIEKKTCSSKKTESS